MEIAKVRQLEKAFGNPKPPSEIWQEPFDYTRGHCERIVKAGYDADPFDISEYFLDYQFMEVQRDLLIYVLPIALHSWAQNLFREEPTGHFQGMWQAFDRRPLYPAFLTANQFEAVNRFMADVLLERMSREDSLVCRGSGASAYVWMSEHGSMMYLLPLIERVWKRWWTLEHDWQAICGLQWWSGFLYDRNDSPIFGPYSNDYGGGNSTPFATEHLEYRAANAENTAYLRTVITLENAMIMISRCCERLVSTRWETVANQFLSDLEIQSINLEERLPNFFKRIEAADSWNKIFWKDITS